MKCNLIAVVLAAALCLPSSAHGTAYRQHHETLAITPTGSLINDGFSCYAYEYATPELAIERRTMINGQEFRRSYPGVATLLTRGTLSADCLLSGTREFNVNIHAQRSGAVPLGAYAVLTADLFSFDPAVPSGRVYSTVLWLAAETPTYVASFSVSGRGWVRISVSTETVLPGDLAPMNEFAIQLDMDVQSSAF